jgi:hypothetical protein
MKPVISTLALALSLGTLSTAAVAETVCMPKMELTASLTDWYGEVPVEGQDNSEVEIWASPENGTWTAVKSNGDGVACVVGQGTDWMAGLRTQETIVASLE